MKSGIGLLLFLLVGAMAQADSFTTVKDGQKYLCESTAITSGAAQACTIAAHRGPFSREESIQLCAGARDNSPAECAEEAHAGPFSKEQAIALCTGTRSITGPMDCAARAHSGPFSMEESIRLCSAASDSSPADCAIKASTGLYSKEEAVQLCRNNPHLVIKALDRVL